VSVVQFHPWPPVKSAAYIDRITLQRVLFPFGFHFRYQALAAGRTFDYIRAMAASRDKAARDFLQLSENPYASLDLLDAFDEHLSISTAATPSDAAQVRHSARVPAQVDLFAQPPPTAQGADADTSHRNPYARLASACDESVEPGEISQATFVSECRRIFGQYIPQLEHGLLRAEHRGFITRNRSRSAKIRFKLLEALRRYDLSDLAGMQPQFNREDDRLTAKKLLEIEQGVGKDE
jgi:hypothetical protein